MPDILFTEDSRVQTDIIRAVSEARRASEILVIMSETELTQPTLQKLAAIILTRIKELSLMERCDIVNIVFRSPGLNQTTVDHWSHQNWSSRYRALVMVLNNEDVTAACFNHAAMGDVNTQQKMQILKSPMMNAKILNRFQNFEHRLGLLRAIAKHLLLTPEDGEWFINHDDDQCRANITRHSWMTAKALYIMRDDANVKVSQAAKKALKVRGLMPTDDIDDCMRDETTLFFMAATPDLDTILRIALSPNTPPEILTSINDLSFQISLAVAQNLSSPPELLEQMTREILAGRFLTQDMGEVEKLKVALAGNPQNTIDVVVQLMETNKMSDRTVLAGLQREDIPIDVIYYFLGPFSSARVCISALKTGRVSSQRVGGLLMSETRTSVIKTILTHYPTFVSDEQLSNEYHAGNADVRALAAQILVSRGYAAFEAKP